MTGPLDPSWNRGGSFSNPSRYQPDGHNGGNVVPENPWFAPPEGFES